MNQQKESTIEKHENPEYRYYEVFNTFWDTLETHVGEKNLRANRLKGVIYEGSIFGKCVAHLDWYRTTYGYGCSKNGVPSIIKVKVYKYSTEYEEFLVDVFDRLCKTAGISIELFCGENLFKISPSVEVIR